MGTEDACPVRMGELVMCRITVAWHPFPYLGNHHLPDNLAIADRCNRQPTSLNLYFWKIWLTNFHRIDIFQSRINRVAAQIFLRFQGKKPGVRRKLS